MHGDDDQAPRPGWQHSRIGSFLLSVGAYVIRAFVLAVGVTYRLEILEGAERLETARREKRPYLLSFWHNRTFLAAWFLDRQLIRHGYDVLVLASLSRDGELVTRLAQRWGLSVVRGSASRGGLNAVRAIHRAIKRQGSSPIMIPDGPRGPIYDFKVGVMVLSQTSGAPILPMGYATQRFFTLKSWDALIVPWPFSKVTVVVGEPQSVSRGLSSEELDAERRRLQALLDELTRRAEDALGVDDVARPHSGSLQR